MKRLRLEKITFVLLLSLLITGVSAQTKALLSVTGKVTDTSGTELAGVTVLHKDAKSAGTITDAQGKFSISIPGGEYLVFSYIGFETQTVQVNTDRQINIQLKESSTYLNEVVITSLNIPREKKALGYSVQGVSDEAFQTRPTNALSALTGKIAGLQVISSGGNLGGSSRITLRGINSITGNNQPLYVIDGVPLDNTDLNTSSTINGSAGKDVGSTKAGQITYKQLDRQIISEHTVIVNASPVGTFPHSDECPDIPYEFLSDRHLLFDVVYNPAETLFLKKGKEQGATCLNGEAMLVGQAVAAWQIWNNNG